MPPPASSATSATCALYPIALQSQTLQNIAPNTIIPNILNGDQAGNFGWLSWAGSQNESTLVTSLTPPGNSQTYVNPDTYSQAASWTASPRS